MSSLDLADMVIEALPEKHSGGADDLKEWPGIIPEPSESKVLITSIACDGNGKAFFVGKEDGSIHVYAIDTGLSTGELFSHAHGVSIDFLHCENQGHALISVDSSSRIMIHRLTRLNRSISAKLVLFDYRVPARSNMLWSIAPDNNTLLAINHYDDREPYRWTHCPGNRNQLVFITQQKAHIYDWRTLQRLTTEKGIQLDGKISPEFSIALIVHCFDGKVLATVFRESNSSHPKSKLVLWSTSDFTLSSTFAVPVPSYCALSDDVELVIGSTSAISGQSQRLIFLHGNQWVCAADMETAKTNRFVRHFFFSCRLAEYKEISEFKGEGNKEWRFVGREG